MRIILTFLGLVTLLGCSKSGTVAVSDVTTTNSFTLVSHSDSVSGLTLHLRGQLDGTGYIYAGNWDTQALSGTIDRTIYHDWFETNCVLHYYSVGVYTGALSIHYEFH